MEVALEGYASARRRVTPRPGLEQVVNISLQTEHQAQLSRIKPEITTSLGQTLLLFTPGDFTMGASRREPGRRSNEVLHPVSLTRMFYMQTTEVTNAEFRLFQASHSSGQISRAPRLASMLPKSVGRKAWRNRFGPSISSTNRGLERPGVVGAESSCPAGDETRQSPSSAWAIRMARSRSEEFPWFRTKEVGAAPAGDFAAGGFPRRKDLTPAFCSPQVPGLR